MTITLRTFIPAAACVLVACATEAPVSIEFADPHQFLWSATVRVVVFDGGACAERQSDVQLGRADSAYFDSGRIPICPVYRGELMIDGLLDGASTYVAETYSPASQAVARGCTENADAGVDGSVVIPMNATEHFLNVLRMEASPCGESAEAKCSSACDAM